MGIKVHRQNNRPWRGANIVELKVSECDFVQRRINKTGAEMKNNDSVSNKMTETIKELLLGVIKSRKLISPYVFVNEQGKPYTLNAVYMAFHRACKRAGIAHLHFHDLRHDLQAWC